MLNFECSFRLPENAPDARISILQIRRGIAGKREHLVPTENVSALPVWKQVGVFHRAEADDTGNFTPLRLRQIQILFGNNLESSLFRLIKQIGQLHRLAAAGLKRLAVLAENRAEPDVGQLERGMRSAECGI